MPDSLFAVSLPSDSEGKASRHKAYSGQMHLFYLRLQLQRAPGKSLLIQTMNRNFNLPRLTEAQKNALFAFGEKTKAGTGCNVIIAARFGHDECGVTIRRLCYVEHVTVDPDLKQIIHDLCSHVATMNVIRPEDYQELLTEARKVDELWRIKEDDLGYFIVNG